MPKDRVHAAARKWARRVRRSHAEVARIGYFGSYARDDYVPGSDLDVLIEVREARGQNPPGPMARAERADRYRPDSFPVGMDIFVYTTDELAALRAGGFGFLRTVESEIRWLD